jgi:transcriptional regulator with XRE-family HTH domain
VGILSLVEKIRILLVKSGNISEAELARRMGITPQNFHNKMKRDNFSESDIAEIAKALDCSYKIEFIKNDTGEKV